ncbi:serine/threonine-protein kinase [Myxococcus sp. SDU36]|uniref:serine/threonine protein kinase n=1 Tax=Myxococcus sp. SDU36 TaxID=2831967 RepID=UPI0025431FFB|nr:serine/threonine-protein kinase [Myxococcus sp. SDU36]WIG93226.1 protein kinase [Myxococcus sp. SDU36]
MSTLNLFGFLKPGSRLDGCRIREWKGGGAYGDVYRGVRAGLPVAVKVSKHRQFSLDNSRSDERLLRELVCLVRLEHPYIAKVKGWSRTQDGRGYLVLEYVEGWTLGEWIERQRPTFQQVARLFAKLTHALEYMHERGVRHRDISLSNIMVRKVDGEPVLIDLGAGEYSGAYGLTDAPLPPGTTRYRSPEAVSFYKENQNNPEARYAFPAEDDLYSLAVCLYDALTDAEPATPAEARKAPRIAVNSASMPPPDARVANPRVPEDFSAWVARWMTRDVEARRPALAAMRETLEELGERRGEAWEATVQPPRAVGRGALAQAAGALFGRRWRVAALALALTALAVAGTLAYPWLAPTATEAQPERGATPTGTHAMPLPASAGAPPAPAANEALSAPHPSPTSERPAPTASSSEAAPTSAPSGARPTPTVSSPQAEAGAERERMSLTAGGPPSPPAPSASAIASSPQPSSDVKESPSVSASNRPPSPAPTAKKPPRTASLPPSRAFLAKCAGATALSAALMGCPAQQVRPSSQSCPEEAVKDMDSYGIDDGQELPVLVDVKQPRLNVKHCEAAGREYFGGWGCSIVVGDGEIVSEITDSAGYIEIGTRLHGRLWTGGDTVVGRYTRLVHPDGTELNVCISLSLNGGAEKLPGSRPGAALMLPSENVRVIYGKWP